MYPFIGCLYSKDTGTFGKCVSSSEIVVCECHVTNDSINLKVLIQHINPDFFEDENYTHITVGVLLDIGCHQLSKNGQHYSAKFSWKFSKDDLTIALPFDYDIEEKNMTIKTYLLMTLRDFQKLVFKNLSNEDLKSFDKEVDKLLPELRDFFDNLDILKTSRYLSLKDDKAIEEIKTICGGNRMTSMKKIVNTIKRFNVSDWIYKIEQLISELKAFDGIINQQQINYRKILSETLNRLQFAKMLSSDGIIYLESNMSFTDFTNKNINNICLFLTCKEFKNKNPREFEDVLVEFKGLCSDKKNIHTCLVVDIDLLSEKLPFVPSKTDIYYVKDGNIHPKIVEEDNAFLLNDLIPAISSEDEEANEFDGA